MTNLSLIFKPDYTPKQMFEMGIFKGNYFNMNLNLPPLNTAISPQAKKVLSGVSKDKLSNKDPQKSFNYYNEVAGSSYEYWKDKNWLRDQDPYGWVNWYINYYGGRRSDDDERQIKRWKAFKIRHSGMSKKYPNSNKIKQGLLQWGIKS